MTKKQGNRFLCIVLSVFGLFVASTVLLLVLFADAYADLRSAEQRSEELQAELLGLQQSYAEQEHALGHLEEQLAESQQREETALREAASIREELEQAGVTAQEELRALYLSMLPDVAALGAGTVLQEYQVDRAELPHYFLSFEIAESDAVYQRIIGKSYVENPDISLSELRYLKLIHYNFEHEIQVGELIVHAELADSALEIFRELFLQEYEIYSMYLIEEFWDGNGSKSDTASCEANNTSAFCYREITGGGELSNHAYGRAIDINPQQNPYVNYSSGKPVWHHRNADAYIDRSTGLAHVITAEDPCFLLFTEHGFDWGGDWETIKDYQHFEKESS